MNYFDLLDSAERYAKGRPRFHGNTIRHIRDVLQISNKYEKALDIACGTGLSTQALLEIAENVYGTDLSPEMLRVALQQDKIKYSVAPAEHQSFDDNTFDLITVGSGVHWFNIDDFLLEANRLLKSRAWLILYENHFMAEMEDHADFKTWFYDVYLKKFPSPPRHNDYSWTNENLNPKNFNIVREEKFGNTVSLSKKQLGLYFTTQSNILAAVEDHFSTYDEADKWLDTELSSFFDDDNTTRTIEYGNWIRYIQRRD